MGVWISQKNGFEKALFYMRDRRDGLITSFKTPWSKFNDATTDGLEWGSTVIIGGRPGAGKTLMKDQLIREGIPLNCTKEEYDLAKFPFRVLEFSLEMVGRVSAIREFTSVTGKSYKYLCSAGGKLTDEDLKKCAEYAKSRISYPIDVVETPPTVHAFRTIIEKYMHEHSKVNEVGERVFKNTVVTLDHTILLKRERNESKFDMLYNLGETLTALKRIYPIAFLILSQLNRDGENPKRNEPGTIGNYVLESDIFGADAMLQHADVLIGLNRPWKNYVKFYGPDQYIIENEDVVVAHFLKCRNGDTRMSFFEGKYKTMEFVEIDVPPTRKSVRTS